MKILLLKQEVLDSIKGNLDQDYQNYFIHQIGRASCRERV